jgi:hypothetical protein
MPHTPPEQRCVAQSFSSTHACPSLHGLHDPPQSTSVSSPSFLPSPHVLESTFASFVDTSGTDASVPASFVSGVDEQPRASAINSQGRTLRGYHYAACWTHASGDSAW